MLGVRLVSRCCVPALRSAVVRSAAPNTTRTTAIRRFQTESKTAWRSWEVADKPRGLSAISIGQGIVGGAGIAGLGALCFYGLGLSNEVGAIDKAMYWPQYVRDRVKYTYLYFSGSLGVTAVSAYYIARSPVVERMMAANKWLFLIGSLGALIGTSVVCQSLPYQSGLFNAKHLAWIGHSSIVGVVIAPLLLLGGPLVARAAIASGVVVGALSLTAACAPSEKFLNWGGPLALCLGGVIIASLGSMFLPATSALGVGLQSITTYGGLVVFGGFLLYDTQKIIKNAEHHPLYTARPYDPINASMGIYMDTINIFIRILIIMSSSNSRRK